MGNPFIERKGFEVSECIRVGTPGAVVVSVLHCIFEMTRVRE